MNIDELITNKLKDWLKLKEKKIDEYNTSNIIVLPILQSLNWDTTDFDQVQAQFPVGSEKIDFVLFDKNRKPVVMIEVKQIDVSLRDSIYKGIINEKKYIVQAKKIECPILVITNGLAYRTYIDIDNKNYVYISAIDFDLSYNAEEPSVINNAKNILMKFKRSNILNSIDFFKQIGLKESSYIELKKLLVKPTQIIKEEIKEKLTINDKTLEYLLSDLKKEIDLNISISPPIIENNDTSIPPKYYQLESRMTGDSKDAISYRKNKKRYYDIWKLLLEKKEISKEELNLALEKVIDKKGNSPFNKAYIGKADNGELTFLVMQEKDGTTIISINPILENNFLKMVKLMGYDK